MVNAPEAQVIGQDRRTRMAQESGVIDYGDDVRECGEGESVASGSCGETQVLSNECGLLTFSFRWGSNDSCEVQSIRPSLKPEYIRERNSREYRRTTYDKRTSISMEDVFNLLQKLKTEAPTENSARERRANNLLRILCNLGWEPDPDKARRFREVVMRDTGESDDDLD